jgi:hypothetical protein
MIIVQKRNEDKSVAVRRKDPARGIWVGKEVGLSGVGVQILETHNYANLW